MLRKITIAMLALILILGTSAWAQIERNPGSRSGTEVEDDEVERARPPKPAAEATEPREGGSGVLLPPPIYLTTAEIAQLTALAQSIKQVAASVGESIPEPAAADDEPAPVPEANPSRFDFSFPASPDEPVSTAVADLPAVAPEQAPADPEPAPEALPEPVEAVLPQPVDKPVLEPLETTETAPQPAPEPTEEPPAGPVVLETEEVIDDPAAQPEQLSVYSPGYEDDAREIAEQLKQNSSDLINSDPDPAPEAELEPATTPEQPRDEPEFHTNWVPRNVNAHRGVGGTRRELPVGDDPVAEPAAQLPAPTIEPAPQPAPAPQPPVEADPEPAKPASDVDSLFTDNYPLDELLGHDYDPPKATKAPAPADPAPPVATETPREWTRDADESPKPRLDRPSLDKPSLTTGGRFEPLLATPATTRQAPTEPQLYFGEPMMPDWDVAAGINNVSRGNPRLKQVALTFDDGPHPEYTSQLLSVLDFYDVPATFFFVGVQAQKYPHWVKMTNQAGHELACHTYDHFRLPKLPREEKAYQIDEFQRLVENLTGVTPRFLRPPGGRLDGETGEMLTERGMVLAMWDVAINDTYEGKTKDDTLGAALKNIRPGSVVLAHDGIQATIDMLPELITTLRAQGYTFVTMSEMAAGL